MKFLESKRAVGWVLVLLALVPSVLGLIFYQDLPDQVASHFNQYGEPDDTQGKLSFLIVTGLINLFIPLLLFGISYIDPKGQNYSKFVPAMRTIALAISLVLSGSLTMVLFYNLGYEIPFDMGRVVMALLGVMYLWIGNVIGQIRPNYFVGIRTPWTIENEEVWRRTHRLAGPLMMIGGLVLVAMAFVPGMTLGWIIPVVLITSVLVPTVYSFLLYRKLKQREQ